MSDQKACAHNTIKISEQDLPLSCPMDGQRVWDAHPKVYLPITQGQVVICPYCESEYQWKE